MALEAGALMHEVFAAVRIWQLECIQGLDEHAQATADRIFGMLRWDGCLRQVTATGHREQLQELAFAVLHTSEWFDDAGDKIRTMANMELASIVYIDERLPNMEGWPIYVEDEGNPRCMIGIEQVFDVVLEYEDERRLRYIGTIDGLVQKAWAKGAPWYLDENKTASRLDEGWRAMFDLSHQTTGYCAASTAVFGFPVMKNRVTGLAIRSSARGEGCIPIEPLERDADMIRRFATWARHTAETYERFKNNWEQADRYTHSCNRYFRPCSLLPFCADTPEGRAHAFEHEMVPADLSPSERGVS